MDKLLTISKIGTSRVIEKKSIFIGQAVPVGNEKEALDFIDQERHKYADARHHTFAYQIGEHNEIQRASDDGEPSGTAGRPILEMIKQENLKDILVVVTRYFGGTLLGTGGLVRAYGKAAHLAIIDGKITEKLYGQKISFTIDYSLLGKVQNYLNGENIYVENILYTDKIQIACTVIYGQIDRITEQLRDMCAGAIDISFGDTGYFAGI